MTAGDRLRLCVLGDLDSIHTRRWLAPFVERGHDVHAVSYYQPSAAPEGATLHVLQPGRPTPTQEGAPTLNPSPRRRIAAALPPTPLRLLNALRYRRRGLGSVIRDLQPDVLHAHYAVEYGFFAATTGYHPLIVTAWGSDILRDAQTSPVARLIARYTLRRADLVTSNNEHMSGLIRNLGVPEEKVVTVVFGTDRFYLEDGDAGVNQRAPEPAHPPTVMSPRSLDLPLYNVDLVLRAMALVRRQLPEARLLVAGGGRLEPGLRRLASDLAVDSAVDFLGFLGPQALRAAFHAAHVYVSVPGSDATAVSTLSAMAAGCFPVLSDLATQREWVEDGVNGFLVPLGSAESLAARLVDALKDDALRRRAAATNRRAVEKRGLWEDNSMIVEDYYRRLAAGRS